LIYKHTEEYYNHNIYDYNTTYNMASLIFLHQGPFSPDIIKTSNEKNIRLMSRTDFVETANDKSLTESKFMGTIALFAALKKPIFLPNAEEFVTKKGGLSLSYLMSTRAKGVTYEFILVTDLDPQNSKDDKLFSCVSKHITLKEFSEYVLPTNVPIDLSNIKVTCGLLTDHVQDEKVVTGHMTRGYGITYDESLVIEENNASHLQKTYNGTIIKLTLNKDKDGGSIVMVSDLGATAHITNNTGIKAMLSGPVLEKYNDGIMEFHLQDIDKTAKQNLDIRVEKAGKTEVLVTRFYVYAI
jgi:hypothetical protein